MIWDSRSGEKWIGLIDMSVSRGEFSAALLSCVPWLAWIADLLGHCVLSRQSIDHACKLLLSVTA